MIPIRDDVPRFTTPWVNYFLVALNSVVFLFEVALDQGARSLLIYHFGLVPAQITALVSRGQHGTAEAALLPILTSMFLHASWLHLIANMWALWIFGDNIEDHLGHGRYLALYLVSGVMGSVLHTAFNPGSLIPSVGASGAIAGVMGAYLLLFPSARVLTLVPFIFVYFVWLPAWLVLGYWFVVQFLGAAATAITYSKDSGGVAFWAHVGGFISGLLLIKLFPKQVGRYRYSYWQ